MKNLITAEELSGQLSNPLLLVVDCRFALDQPTLGRDQYRAGHVQGAVYLSLNEDLSSPVAAHGGRHPLPSVTAMAELFSKLGITRNATPVVAYDDGGGAFAARLWWMLRYLGHERVRVLDGGFTAYIEAGGPVSPDVPSRPPSVFEPEVRQEMLASIREIADIARQGRLIDARAPERFAGENETIDAKAGHIPGARNHYWMKNLDARNRFLDPAGLLEMLRAFPENAVMQCGSGVTACVNVLAMEEAGLPLPRLFAGSWSDWISYPDNPIATGLD
jgi:thiosulfate/3-mercaptopyruvate sulfurtransferase